MKTIRQKFIELKKIKDEQIKLEKRKAILLRKKFLNDRDDLELYEIDEWLNKILPTKERNLMEEIG